MAPLADSPAPPSVLIVEDHLLLAHSLAICLGSAGLSAQVAPLSSRADLVDLVRDLGPDVVLLDLDLGSLGNSLSLVATLTALGTRVIIVSGTPSPTGFAAALEQGAVGFVTKGQPFDQLIAAVIDTAARRPILAEADRLRLLRDLRTARAARSGELRPFLLLTNREQSVLKGLIAGTRADALAAAVHVSEATIRSQLRGVLTKLGVTSQLEAVAAARRAGWPASM